jgi:hypothetical protein
MPRTAAPVTVGFRSGLLGTNQVSRNQPPANRSPYRCGTTPQRTLESRLRELPFPPSAQERTSADSSLAGLSVNDPASLEAIPRLLLSIKAFLGDMLATQPALQRIKSPMLCLLYPTWRNCQAPVFLAAKERRDLPAARHFRTIVNELT